MAEIKIDGRMKVGKLKELFKEEFKGILRVYNGSQLADDNATLASIRCNEEAKCGEFICRASRTVGKFREELLNDFGIKVKVATPDDWVIVLDGITLATIKDLPNQTTKSEMENFIAYKHENKEGHEPFEDSVIPNNEIWYTSDEPCTITAKQPWFDAEIVEQTFSEGKGIIKFSKDITTIYSRAFTNAKFNFKSITLPDSITNIEGNRPPFKKTVANIEAFYGKFSSDHNRCLIIDNSLCHVSIVNIGIEYAIPEGVEIIKIDSFPQNDSIEHLIIPESCSEIEFNAFANLSNLKSITFKGSLQKVGIEIVSRDYSVLEYMEGPQVSDDHKCLIVNNKLVLVAGGDAVDEYSIPNGIEAIQHGAFGKRNQIKKLIIPEECTQFEHFSLDCPSFEHITFKGKIEEFDAPTIQHAINLKSFEGPSISKDSCSIVVDNRLSAIAGADLTEYAIPEGVEILADGLFQNCNSLKKIIVPPSVNAFESDPFIYDNLESIEEIYFLSDEPIIYSDDDTDPEEMEDCVIYVPSESIEKYKEAEGWETYVDCIQPIPNDFHNPYEP